MKKTTTLAMAVVVALAAAMAPGAAWAADTATSLVGASGYDVVAYHTQGEAVRGSGYHVVEYEGVTYAFASEENANLFKADPEKYLPEYGGYCAYGVAVGKKFVANPEIWKIVDGKLYLNLDAGIQQKWEEDLEGHIDSADDNWTDIEGKDPSEL